MRDALKYLPIGCLFTIILLLATFAGMGAAAKAQAEGRDVIPSAKFMPPSAVVVSQCGAVVGVAFTDQDGNVTDFPVQGLSIASVLLFIGKAGKLLRYDLPCV